MVIFAAAEYLEVSPAARETAGERWHLAIATSRSRWLLSLRVAREPVEKIMKRCIRAVGLPPAPMSTSRDETDLMYVACIYDDLDRTAWLQRITPNRQFFV